MTLNTNTNTMLEQISTSIEKTVRTLPAARAARKRMTLSAFVPYALAQVEQAGGESRQRAKRRLDALKRSVDQVAARVAKLNAEDLDSEQITVEVETAFAPIGGPSIEGLTTAADQSSTETALTSVDVAGGGDTNFAQNLGEVAKALQKLKADLDAKPDKSSAANQSNRASAQKATTERGTDANAQGWPLDLNTRPFRDGVTKAEDEPTWGYDPEGVRSFQSK